MISLKDKILKIVEFEIDDMSIEELKQSLFEYRYNFYNDCMSKEEIEIEYKKVMQREADLEEQHSEESWFI